ncbi:universal stress protein [uncultured Sneathiella sp.]|jgi:nucleotide-binding universal stress UspA family protein|uniref:universal stress protein n=1 Tax=uncultured Sneathiella sp. TaxID=879315 RepID=UPI0030D8E126|tara:strand:- start:832 stop:1317 length:486 start_codon:yes stop_codon:yes gene_type:complete
MSDDTHSGVRNKFLVVVDDTPECKSAIRFASRRAWHVGGGVILLYVIEPPEFQHWMGVEQAMREEARETAEELLQNLAEEIQKETTLVPEFVIRDGYKKEEVLALIEEDSDIRVLVLAASPESGGPGPLIKSLVGEMSGTFAIPITVVPGNLTTRQLDAVT